MSTPTTRAWYYIVCLVCKKLYINCYICWMQRYLLDVWWREGGLNLGCGEENFRINANIELSEFNAISCFAYSRQEHFEGTTLYTTVYNYLSSFTLRLGSNSLQSCPLPCLTIHCIVCVPTFLAAHLSWTWKTLWFIVYISGFTDDYFCFISDLLYAYFIFGFSLEVCLYPCILFLFHFLVDNFVVIFFVFFILCLFAFIKKTFSS